MFFLHSTMRPEAIMLPSPSSFPACLLLGASILVTSATPPDARAGEAVPGARISMAERERAPVLRAIARSSIPGRPGRARTPATARSMVFTVTNTADTGDGSFRKAINDANVNPGPDVINFSIPGTGPFTITPLSKLPSIIDPVTIDGTTQAGYLDRPVIELNMGSIGSFSAFDLFAGGCTIRGLAINRLTGGSAIVLWTGDGNVIEGNYIGTDITGEIKRANQGNGVIVYTAGNRIGGTTALQGNVISGNAFPGIVLTGTGAVRNVVEGNLIGTDAAGLLPIGNTQEGILMLEGAGTDTIGGPVPGAGNIISGSVTSSGISILDSAAAGIVICGNYIGTDVTGHAAIPNAGNGIFIRNTPGVTIGGTTPGARNVISGNTFPGIFLDSSKTQGTRVLGNHIGTDVTGTAALPNLKGIVINDAPQNLIGGRDAAGGNLISGNTQNGVEIRGLHAVGNTVQGNTIGVNGTGTDTLPNYATGVFLNGASRTLIGGSQQGAGNVIGGNKAHGVSIIGATAHGNVVGGNSIGTDRAGTLKLGNGGNGVYLDAAEDSIGSPAPNVIAHNTGNGVAVSSGTGHLIVDNAVYDNGGLGIDLFPPGLTVNDTLDADTGANGLQNFPLLDSVRAGPANLTILGHLNSQPNTAYRLDFYSMDSVSHSHFGEGKYHLDSAFVTTGAAGRGDFSATVRLPPAGHSFIAATATDPQGSTSEFSQCFGLADADGDGIPDFWETKGWGIDVNSDGIIDLDLYALGARPDHKDLFVEVDAMQTRVPFTAALDSVVAAFRRAPRNLIVNPDGKPGIELHYQLDDTAITLERWTGTPFTHFRDLERRFFGTAAERNSGNARFILAAKNLVFRYCIFADAFDNAGSSGKAAYYFAEGCNEFMVTLGMFPSPGGTRDEQAGTFMHELGHTLGLRHGGGDDINYKPNYISIMNYTWQIPFNWANTWRLTYSPLALPTLNEAALSERNGLNPPRGVFPVVGVPFSDALRVQCSAKLKENTPVDWDSNFVISNTPVSVDINIFDPSANPSPGEILTGHEDWSALAYNFRHGAGWFTGGVSLPKKAASPDPGELDVPTMNFLNSLPPARPSGVFRMDGHADSCAAVTASNHGITARAAYINGELYVTAPSARAENADVHVFISETPGPLIAGPPSTTGQVAGWIAVLSNRLNSGAPVWLKPGGDTIRVSAAAISVADTLEGVIDLDYLLARSPGSVYLAVGVYQAVPGGSLIDQAPAGNGDGNIDLQEFASIDATSPVLFASFTGKAVAGQGVRLEWTTIAEGAVLGFDIQKRLLSQPNFTTITGSFTTAQGSPIESHTYAYLDSLASGGDWHYRLRVLDRDSVPSFSAEISVPIAGIHQGEGLPTAFALMQNYPNPFNPATTISYDLPAAVHVSLKVYDILGREVETLVDGLQQPGRYRETWKPDGSAASGVYFVRIHAGTFVSTRKMLLVR